MTKNERKKDKKEEKKSPTKKTKEPKDRAMNRHNKIERGRERFRDKGTRAKK